MYEVHCKDYDNFLAQNVATSEMENKVLKACGI